MKKKPLPFTSFQGKKCNNKKGKKNASKSWVGNGENGIMVVYFNVENGENGEQSFLYLLYIWIRYK